MTDILKARDAKDVEAAVQWALAEGKALAVQGRGSKRGIGRPSQTDLTLDLSGLTGVTLYEPEELVLSARAGTPLAEIEALVAGSGQELAFEPMDFAAIFGGAAGAGRNDSIGGVLAANASGPRRIKAGAARDHFLGVTAVSGRGETFRSGGRVVKNVTGYDLCKLIAGSWGTLAVMTDVTIKTLPRAETEETVVIAGLDPPRAVAAMAAAMRSASDPSAAAHVPAQSASRIPAVASLGQSVTALRLEGVAPSVAHRKRGLDEIMRAFGVLAALPADQSRALWRAVRDVTPFATGDGGAGRPLWRLSTTPGKGAALGAELMRLEAECIYDWAGGLVWAALPETHDAGAAGVRAAMARHGGHATLIRASTSVRAAVDIFSPQESGVAALTRRVKAGFDPSGLLNPGRMYAGV